MFKIEIFIYDERPQEINKKKRMPTFFYELSVKEFPKVLKKRTGKGDLRKKHIAVLSSGNGKDLVNFNYSKIVKLSYQKWKRKVVSLFWFVATKDKKTLQGN